jgi:hypothetical protein
MPQPQFGNRARFGRYHLLFAMPPLTCLALERLTLQFP